MYSKETDQSYMRKFLLVILTALLAWAASAQEQKDVFGKLSFGKYGIDNIWPASFSSVTGAVWVEIDNASEGFTVSQIKGTVYREGTRFITGTADNVYIAKGQGKYVVSGKASLCSGVSLLSILRLLSFDPNVYSVDMSIVVTLDSGHQQTMSVEKLPVSALLKLK